MFSIGGLSLRLAAMIAAGATLIAGQLWRPSVSQNPQVASSEDLIECMEPDLDDGSVGLSDTTASDRDLAARSPSGIQPTVVRRVCRVTAYCDRGITASGRRVGPGQCAAPANIPFGSRVYIPALGRSFVVTDRTHRRFRHNTVDIFMPSRELCRKFGRKYLQCEFILPSSTSVAAPESGKDGIEIATRSCRTP